MENIIINVNSEFRDPTKYSSSNFVYFLDEEIRNIIYIKVTSIELPTTNYNFLISKGNTSFVIGENNDYNFTTLTIEDGNYTPESLVTKIQSKFDTINNNLNQLFNITLNANTNKITLMNHTKFFIDFTNQDLGYNSLGKELGFIKNTYEDNTRSFTAENVINLSAPKYCFLKVNQIDNILDYNVKNAFAKIIKTSGDFDYIYEGYGDYTTKAKVFRNPTNLSRLEIQLVDHKDNIIDLNGADFSFTLEIGYVYDKKLYEEFLNNGIPNGDIRTKFFF